MGSSWLHTFGKKRFYIWLGSFWLHTYGRKRFYIRERVNFPKCKTNKKEGKWKK